MGLGKLSKLNFLVLDGFESTPDPRTGRKKHQFQTQIFNEFSFNKRSQLFKATISLEYQETKIVRNNEYSYNV